jgi:hypothetical protein
MSGTTKERKRPAVKNRKEILFALARAADGYRCAALYCEDIVDGRTPLTHATLEVLKTKCFGGTTQGDLGVEDAVSKASNQLID